MSNAKENSRKLLTSSETNEWYTPQWLTNHCKKFYDGSITLDPFTCPLAQSWIEAENYWTINSPNPLNLASWKVANYVKLWCNPPYGNMGGKCILKIIEQFEKGNVDEALILVKGDSNGIKRLVRIAVWLEFDERINFIKPNGSMSHSGIPGIRLFYLCSNIERKNAFHNHFQPLGVICERREMML